MPRTRLNLRWDQVTASAGQDAQMSSDRSSVIERTHGDKRYAYFQRPVGSYSI